MDSPSLSHLHGLRDFVRNLVEQAERSAGCECHRPPSLLLIGPPGAGKTFLVKSMSSVCDMPLFGVHTHQLSGPKSLRSLFQQARELDYPSLFFLDDVEFIFSNQDLRQGHEPLVESLRNELYNQLGHRKLKIFDPSSARNPVQSTLPFNTSPTLTNGVEEKPDNNGLILVAATSEPWLLYKDHELLSRFRGVYLVGLPDRETRFHILKNLLQKVQHNLTEKELWLVADKTEGYTPSDLMIITKALNYEQFSFLFSMAGFRGYDGESSDEESISSSEMTETDLDSNYGHVDERPSVGGNERVRPRTPEPEDIKDISSSLESFRSKKEADSSPPKEGTLENLAKEWSEEEEVEESKKEEDNRVDKEVKENEEESIISENKEKSLSAEGIDDGATTTHSASSEPVKEKEESLLDSSSETPEVSFVPSNCDSISNVRNNDVICEEESSPKVERPFRRIVTTIDTGSIHSEPVTPLPSDDDTKEFEFHVFHPAEPFRDDNQAIESGSGSDSDNENVGDYSSRTRRVNFCNVPSMHPLTVDIDHTDNLSSSNSIGYDPNVSLSPGLNDNLLSKDPYCGPSPNNILKRLLSSSPTLHDGTDDDTLNSKNSRNKDISSIVKNDTYHQNNYMDDYSNSNLRGSPIGNDETDSIRTRKDNNKKSPDLQTFPRSPSILRNNLSEDRRSLRGVSPQLTGVSPQLTGVSPRLRAVSPQLTGVSPQLSGTQLTRVSPQLTGVSPLLTPTGSDTSSHLATDNSSESGSGRRIRMNTPTGDSENNKSRDSDSSSYEKSETPTIPSSDVSTATCNVSGETLACHSDSDERLRNLDEAMKGRRPRRSSGTEDEDEDELSGEENGNTHLRTIFDLNNLGEFSIKILTVNDVLNVVNRTPRSISDEEIKRYTDFMVWFSKVAKSACPHNSKGTVSDTASSANVSVDSSTWSHSTATKKRKGPLRKLGRFLLKALMFILD